MRRNLSKKRIGALTLTVIMAIQIPTMATETTLENTEQNLLPTGCQTPGTKL